MKNKKGFTLIELLVVIAIIGILSSVAIVNLNSARDKARMATLESYLKSVMPAITLCYDEGNLVQRDDSNPCIAAFEPITPGGNLCNDPVITWPEFPDGVILVSCGSQEDDNILLYGSAGSSGQMLCTYDTGVCQQ